MVTALLVLGVVGAVPPSLLIVPATPASRPVCEELLEVFTASKVTVKLAGPKAEAVTCASKKGAAARTACLVDSLQRAKTDGLVVIAATVKAGKVVATLQLLSRKGENARVETVRAPRARLAALAAPAVDRTVQTLRAVMLIEEVHALDEPKPAPKPEPVADDRPVRDDSPSPEAQPAQPLEVTLKPAPPRPIELTQALAPTPAPKSRVGAGLVTALAIAAAGAGGTFGVLGFVDKGRLERTTDGLSPLTYSRATALKAQANLELTVGLSAGIAAVVAAVVAGILWAQ